MKVLARAFAITLVAVGLFATCRSQSNHGASLLEYKAAREGMPIPVCPPNDPNACHIDKW